MRHYRAFHGCARVSRRRVARSKPSLRACAFVLGWASGGCRMKWLLLSLVALVSGSSGCSGDPAVPYERGSPWPKFRGNAAQDGKSARTPPTTGGVFWSFQTGKGIFSSPVVAADGTIYVGSADRTFYALNPDGTVRWQSLTGEIIDSAALLDDRGRVYVGSGDGWLRAFD